MKNNYIIGIDQSTSGTKVLLVNSEGKIVYKNSKQHKQHYSEEDWVGHDAMEIYENVKQLINEAVEFSTVSAEEIKVLSITNQRETIVVWDKVTGIPICNAIVWQCQRTSESCQELIDKGFEFMVKQKTGLTIDPYFSASKIKWMLDYVDGAREKAVKGRLLTGTIDSWLIWKLTNGQTHATDVTNASRTLLYNIHTLKWDDDLLDLFTVPLAMLPVVKNSDALFGKIQEKEIVLEGLPISGVIGDSQGALFGQQCFEIGMAKATFGTGTSVLVHTGELRTTENGLVTSVAWGYGGKVSYALEGIIRTTGDILNWMRHDLGLFKDFDEAEKLAVSIADNQGVYLVPAFVGLGAPYWSPDTRAAITGMSRATGKAHLIRAGLESIAYQVRDIIELTQQEAGTKIKALKVDGGAISNQFLMQFIADMLGVKVIASDTAELSVIGAVFLGGLGVGIWESMEEIKKINFNSKAYYSEMRDELKDGNYSGWKEAVNRVLVAENESVSI
ncbi:glycerol kinase GlpK [Sediminibacillus massiliensis]|uniref:glycerol kinase GlpK n=1 Tax=Sediminibacillus massiliensis TaxID=1926277 RepID=UPI000988442F|nr:glycerol kinase GlpK [Sediminibacillus massiliensis]